MGSGIRRRDCKLKCEIEMQNGKPSVMESVNLYILEIQIRLQINEVGVRSVR